MTSLVRVHVTALLSAGDSRLWNNHKMSSSRLFCAGAQCYRPYSRQNKSSGVAEMGDRLATIDMGQKVEAAVSLSVGELVPI